MAAQPSRVVEGTGKRKAKDIPLVNPPAKKLATLTEKGNNEETTAADVKERKKELQRMKCLEQEVHNTKELEYLTH